MERSEVEADIKAYARSMIDGDHVAGARIEKKYGLYGATPEYVSTALAQMLDEDLGPEISDDEFAGDGAWFHDSDMGSR